MGSQSLPGRNTAPTRLDYGNEARKKAPDRILTAERGDLYHTS